MRVFIMIVAAICASSCVSGNSKDPLERGFGDEYATGQKAVAVAENNSLKIDDKPVSATDISHF